jgi:hypothetical protein
MNNEKPELTCQSVEKHLQTCELHPMEKARWTGPASEHEPREYLDKIAQEAAETNQPGERTSGGGYGYRDPKTGQQIHAIFIESKKTNQPDQA